MNEDTWKYDGKGEVRFLPSGGSYMFTKDGKVAIDLETSPLGFLETKPGTAKNYFIEKMLGLDKIQDLTEMTKDLLSKKTINKKLLLV